jgi:hypothetical protein
MAAPDRRLEATESHRTLIVAVAIAAAVVIALVFGFLMWAISSGPGAGVTLQGAIRRGNPEFEKHAPHIVLDEPEGFEAKRALGDLTMTLRTTVRNLTGKTITGLEIKGSVVDYEGKPVKEKTLIVVPSDRQPELPPNKTMQAQMMLDGMKDTDPRAQIKMEVMGFKIKD